MYSKKFVLFFKCIIMEYYCKIHFMVTLKYYVEVNLHIQSDRWCVVGSDFKFF